MTPKRDDTVVDMPAKLHGGHSQTHGLGANAGAKKGWRNDGEHPLSLAYAKGQLIRGSIQDERGNAKYCALERITAGDEYRKHFEEMHRSGRDSTDMDVVSSGGGFPITETMNTATKKIAAIEHHLKGQDKIIVRRVCGEGWWPSEAVREAAGITYEKATVPRLNEALDNLIEAIEAARAENWSFMRK